VKTSMELDNFGRGEGKQREIKSSCSRQNIQERV